MMLLAGLLLLLAGCSSPAAAAKLTGLQPAERTRTALLAKVVAGEAIAGLPAAQLTAANGQADEHVYVPELEGDKGNSRPVTAAPRACAAAAPAADVT